MLIFEYMQMILQRARQTGFLKALAFTFVLFVVLGNFADDFKSAKAGTDLYYNDAMTDGDPTNLANWWQDAGFTIQAENLPTHGDDLHIYGGVYMWGNSNLFSSGGSITFYDGGYVQEGQIDASTVTFNGSSYAQLAYVSGSTVTLNDNSYLAGSASLGASVIIFNNFSYYDGGGQSSNISGNFEFYDSSYMSFANITGDVLLENNSYLTDVNVDGDVVFNDNSYFVYQLAAEINGSVVFNDSSSIQLGTINGDVVFTGSSSNGFGNIYPDTMVIFAGTSSNTGTVEGDACFAPTAANDGTVSGEVSVCVGPGLASSTPEAGGVDIPVYSNLVLTFDKDVDIQTGNIEIYRASDDSLFESIDVTSGQVTGDGSDEITINPADDFEGGVIYYVLIDSGTFSDSNTLVFAGITDSTVWSFTTAEALEIVSLSPADNSVGVSISSNLEIQFNQVVGVEEGNFTIYKALDDSIFEQFTHGGNDGVDTYIIDPVDNFEYGTEYYVLISENWVGSNGGYFVGISDPTAWNFTTETLSAPSSSSGSTVSGSGGGRGGGINPPPPPAETCETNPSLCPPPTEPTDPTPPPASPESCATNPSLCPPPPPAQPTEPTETCATNSALCPSTVGEETPEEFTGDSEPEDEPVDEPVVSSSTEDNEQDSPRDNTFSFTVDCPEGVIQSALCIARESFDYTKSVLGVTFEQAWEVIQSPQGNFLTKTISTVSLVFGVTFAILPVLFLNPLSFAELALLPARLWSLLMSALGIRKKTRKWGVVYDSVTKQPLDPVYLSLQDIEGKEITSSITDIDGRYGFLVGPGKYRIVPKKTNYSFPSLKVAGKSRDEIYLDLYFGYVFEVSSKGEVISKNIPMDPISFNWNEFAKDEQKLTKFYSKRDLVFNKISDYVFSFGFVISGIALISAPVFYNILIFCLYLVLLVVREIGFKQKKSSRVIRKGTDIPLAYAIVRIYESKTKTEVLNKITDRIGKFYALVRNGEYYLTIEAKKPDGKYKKVFESEVFKVKEGVIDQDFRV